MIDDAQARAEKIAALGGLSDAKCIWRDCEQMALFEMAICLDHAYPEFEQLLASQNAAWYKVRESDAFAHTPERVCSAEDAMRLLGCAAKRWWTGFDNIHPQDERADFDRWDAQLARFVSENPGALESLLGEIPWQERLAYTCTDGGMDGCRDGQLLLGLPTSILTNFLSEASPADGAFLWRTLRACNAAFVLHFALRCRSRFPEVLQPGSAESLCTRTAQWLGADRFATLAAELVNIAPPELLDALQLCAVDDERDRSRHIQPVTLLPALLPDSEKEIVALGSEAVTRRLTEYTGLSGEDLHGMLIRENFLATGENVGEVIVRDAQTLLDLNVPRHRLADALRSACIFGRWQEGRRACVTSQRAAFKLGQARCQIGFESYLGHHQDPFHSIDTYYISSDVGGSADCVISSQNGEIAFGDMLPYLIRRACFFEGFVEYRLDPRMACRVLGLA